MSSWIQNKINNPGFIHCKIFVLFVCFSTFLIAFEIQPVHPKGDQSWVFTGRTDAEAETSNTLATWWEELTHLKRTWCWERLRAGGEGDDRGWDGWMASPTQWTWVWVNSGSWWWTGRPGVMRFMGSQTAGHDWATELNWIAFLKKNKTVLCTREFIARFFE